MSGAQDIGFTVCTTTFNRAGTLRRPYESLRAQTCRDFEWLVIDDGSTDGTRDLVEEWQRRAEFPIRYYHQPNQGQAAALNHGLGLARGEFFLQLDSDDGCRDDSLSTFREVWLQIPVAARATCAGVVAQAEDEQGRPVGDLPRAIIDATFPEMHFRYGLRHEMWILVRSDIYRRYPLPQLAGYRDYMPQGIVFGRISQEYWFRFTRTRLRVYWQHDAEAAHITAGVGRAAALRHSPGFRLSHLECLQNETGWFWRAPFAFLRIAAHYCHFSFRQGIGLRSQIRELRRPGARVIWGLSLPLGWGFYLWDRMHGV